MNKIVCVSGGFDPLHTGHLQMFREAAEHGLLTVIVNSDDWLLRKKGFRFLPWEQRAELIGDLKYVDRVVPVNDADDTVCDALRTVKPDFFANGGDRKVDSTAEVSLCRALGIDLLWNIGGGKVESSSEIFRRACVSREWGHYCTLEEGEDFKVKKLVVMPGKTLSMQYHEHRNEYWYVAKSVATVRLDGACFEVKPGDHPVLVERGMQHQLMNAHDTPLVVIEIQSGAYLGEDDIVRLAESEIAEERLITV